MTEVSTLEEVIGWHIGSSKILIWPASLLGFLATALASIGLYGERPTLLAEGQKRLGLGWLWEQRSNVLRMILFEGFGLIMTGVVIGLVLSAVVTRLMDSLLYGISPTDPLTFISVAALLTMVALLACYVPARKATKVDPMVALRYE